MPRARIYGYHNDYAACNHGDGPWAKPPQLPPCPRPIAFGTGGHIVALAHAGRAPVAVRPCYVLSSPHEGLRWQMQPADNSILPTAVANFVIGAGQAARVLAETPIKVALESDAHRHRAAARAGGGAARSRGIGLHLCRDRRGDGAGASLRGRARDSRARGRGARARCRLKIRGQGPSSIPGRALKTKKDSGPDPNRTDR